MKKLLSYAVLALVSTFVFVGCKPAENNTTTPPPTNGVSTNATTPTNP